MTIKNKTAAVAALAGVLAAPAVQAAEDRSYLIFEASFVEHESRVRNMADVYGARIGVGMPLAFNEGAALEVGIFGNLMKDDLRGSDNQTGLMADLVQYWDLGMLAPYVGVGVGAVREPGRLDRDETSLGAEVIAGLRLDLANGNSLRFGAGAMNVYNDDVRPDKNDFTDYRFNFAVLVPFGDKAAPAPVAAAPEPVAAAPIAPAEPERDTDADGVPDSQDKCEGTLEGLRVDGNGCVSDTKQKIVLKGVTFVPSSAELTPDAKKVLDEAYEALAGQENLKVEVGGHTDSQGDDKFNAALSQRRANSVKAYLVGKGIAKERLTAMGYGESQPVADNKVKEGRAQNRRVELKILD